MFRLRYRCEELKRKKEEEEQQQQVDKQATREGDIQKQPRTSGDGRKLSPRPVQGCSPRPEPPSSDRETSSESQSNNGVQNLLLSSSKETAILDSTPTEKNVVADGNISALQTKYPFGDLEGEGEEEDSGSKRRKDKAGRSKEIIVIEASRQGQSAADQQRIKVFDVRRREERERRAAAAGGSSMGGRNMSCDAVNRLVAAGPDMTSSSPPIHRYGQHGGSQAAINRRLSECSLAVTTTAAAFPSPRSQAFASGGDRGEAAAATVKTTSRLDGRSSLRVVRTVAATTEMKKWVGEDVKGPQTSGENQRQDVSSSSSNGSCKTDSAKRRQNSPAVPIALHSSPKMAATTKTNQTKQAGTPGGLVATLSLAVGPTDMVIQTVQQNVIGAAPIQSHAREALHSGKSTLTKSSPAVSKEICQSVNSGDHLFGQDQPSKCSEKEAGKSAETEAIYATIEDTGCVFSETYQGHSPEVIYASVNKRAKRPDSSGRTDGNGHGLEDINGQKDRSCQKDSIKRNVISSQDQKDINGRKDSNIQGQKDNNGHNDSNIPDQKDSNGCKDNNIQDKKDNPGSGQQDSNGQDQKDNNGQGQKDDNGNPNGQKKEGGTFDRSYERQILYKNPFQGSDDGVASTLM